MTQRRTATEAKRTSTGATTGFFKGLLLVLAALILAFVILRPTAEPPPVVVTEEAIETKPNARERVRSHFTPPVSESQTDDVPGAPEGHDDGALSAQQASDRSPQSDAEGPFDADMKRAIALIEASKPDEAAAILEGILQKDPKNEQALIELAMVNLLDFRRYDAATGLLERVLEVNPKNRVIMSELVSLYEEQGQPENGIVWFTDFAAKNPDVPDAAWGLGQILSSQGRDSEAIAWLEKASATQNDRDRVLGDLADAYSRTGQGDKAVAAYRQAIEVLQRQSTEKVDQGFSPVFLEERLNHLQMDLVREYLTQRQLDRAEEVLGELRARAPADEGVTTLAEQLRKQRAG